MIRLWDISTDGVIADPLSIAVINDYPIYCCALQENRNNNHYTNDSLSNNNSSKDIGVSYTNNIEIVCCGGDGSSSFIGTPIHSWSLK